MRERSPGVWELRVYLGRHPITGRRVDASRTFRGGERAAGRELAKVVTSAGHLRAEAFGDGRADDALTVAELLDRWQQLRAAEWSPTTAHDHAGTVARWITPHIGDVAVVDLRRARIEEFYAHVARSGGRNGAPLSATSVRKIHTVLHAALEDAVALELIAGNPSTKARRPKVTKHDARVPSLAEIRRAIGMADPDMAALIRVAIDAGTVDTLRALRRRRQEQWVQLGRGRLRAADWIWFEAADPTAPLSPDKVTHRWKRTAHLAGLDGVRLHDLRHATATHMVAAGIDIRTVSGRLRHASPAMTLDVYADRAAATLLGGQLDG